MKRETEDRERSLAWLADFVNGRVRPGIVGLWTRLGVSEDQDRLHEAMLELERRGQARLIANDQDRDIFIWGPTEGEGR